MKTADIDSRYSTPFIGGLKIFTRNESEPETCLPPYKKTYIEEQLNIFKILADGAMHDETHDETLASKQAYDEMTVFLETFFLQAKFFWTFWEKIVISSYPLL